MIKYSDDKNPYLRPHSDGSSGYEGKGWCAAAKACAWAAGYEQALNDIAKSAINEYLCDAVAEIWDEIEEEGLKRTINEGLCATIEGPCACGAWHHRDRK